MLCNFMLKLCYIIPIQFKRLDTSLHLNCSIFTEGFLLQPICKSLDACMKVPCNNKIWCICLLFEHEGENPSSLLSLCAQYWDKLFVKRSRPTVCFAHTGINPKLWDALHIWVLCISTSFQVLAAPESLWKY